MCASMRRIWPLSDRCCRVLSQTSRLGLHAGPAAMPTGPSDERARHSRVPHLPPNCADAPRRRGLGCALTFRAGVFRDNSLEAAGT